MYDPHSLAMRNVNHAMVADLSKRQMPYSPMNLPPNALYPPSRHPKDVIDSLAQQRIPGYPVMPVRMPTGPLKRPLDEATSDAMLKRMRSEIPALKGGINVNPSLLQQQQQRHDWRNDVGKAIEEPLMMVHGEGSGSDCDAVNPICEEEIEEPLMYFYGEGLGADCDTGNPTDKTSENKTEGSNKEGADSSEACSSDVKSSKPKIKLGVQVFSPTVSSTKRTSRWDVGAPDDKANISAQDTVHKSDDDSVSPPKFFFGPNCVSYPTDKTKDSGISKQLEFKTNEDNNSSTNKQSQEKDTKELQEDVQKIGIETKVQKEIELCESSVCKSEESAKNDSNEALLDLQSETNEMENPEDVSIKKNKDESGEENNEIIDENKDSVGKEINAAAKDIIEPVEKEKEKSSELTENFNSEVQKNQTSEDTTDTSIKSPKFEEKIVKVKDELNKESLLEDNKNQKDSVAGSLDDELSKTLAAIEDSENTASVEKTHQQEDRDLEMELSKMEESDLESTLASMGEGTEKVFDSANKVDDEIEKDISKLESGDCDKPQNFGDDSSMFGEETFDSRGQTDSITNLLSTLEKDEDSESKLKTETLKNTVQENVTDFKQTADQKESDLLSVLEDKVMSQEKIDGNSQKNSESDKSNLLSILEQDEGEVPAKMIDDSNLIQNKTLEASQIVTESLPAANASKLEDSNFFRDFGKENKSLFGAELDDTVKMEETFSVENTSRLVRLSPERMDESLSSHEASFRENINTESREPTDIQENSTSRPMSISDEQTNQGVFSFSKADDIDSMSNGSEQNKGEMLLLPPSASLTVENLKQKNAETQENITIPGILGIKRLGGNASEASSLIAECASSIREDEEDGFSVDPIDPMMTDDKSNEQNKDEMVLLPPSASLTVENLKQKNAETEESIIPEILSIKRLDGDASEASSLIAECSSIREDEEDGFLVDAIITDEKSNEFKENHSPSTPDISMDEKSTSEEIKISEEPSTETLSKEDVSSVIKVEEKDSLTEIQTEKLLNERDGSVKKENSTSLSASKDEKCSGQDEVKAVKSDIKEKADELVEKLSALKESEDQVSVSESSFKSLVPHYDSSSEDDKNFDDLSSENITKSDDSTAVTIQSARETLVTTGKEIENVINPKVLIEHESQKEAFKISAGSNKTTEQIDQKEDGKVDFSDNKESKILEDEKEKTPAQNEIESSEFKNEGLNLKDDASEKLQAVHSIDQNIVDTPLKNKTESDTVLVNHENKDSSPVNETLDSAEIPESNSFEVSHEESNFSEIIKEDIQVKTSPQENLKNFSEQQKNEKSYLESEFNAKLEDQSPIVQASKKRKEERNDFISKTFYEKQQINEIIPKNKLVSAYQVETPKNTMILDENCDSLKHHEKLLHTSNSMELNEIKNCEQLENEVIQEDKFSNAPKDKNCADELKKESFKRSLDELEDLPPTKYKSLESEHNLEKHSEELPMETDLKINDNKTKHEWPVDEPLESLEILCKKDDSSLERPEETQSIESAVAAIEVVKDPLSNEPLVDQVVKETQLLEQESSVDDVETKPEDKSEIQGEIKESFQKKFVESEAVESKKREEKMQTTELPAEKIQVTEDTVEKSQEDVLMKNSEEPGEKMQVNVPPAENKLEQANVEEEYSDDSMGGNDESMFDAPPDDEADSPQADSESEPTKITKQLDSIKTASELTLSDQKQDTPDSVETAPSTPAKTLESSLRSTRASRKRRNSAHDSNSEDLTTATKVPSDEEETTAGKRMKLRGKRQPDLELRKSVEKTRKISASSEDDSTKPSTEANLNECSLEEKDEDQAKKARGRPKKRKGISKGIFKSSFI